MKKLCCQTAVKTKAVSDYRSRDEDIGQGSRTPTPTPMSLSTLTLKEKSRVNRDKKRVTWKEMLQTERELTARPQSLHFSWKKAWRNRKGGQMKTG